MSYVPTETITGTLTSEVSLDGRSIASYGLELVVGLARDQGIQVQIGFSVMTKVLSIENLTDGYRYLLQMTYELPPIWKNGYGNPTNLT